MNKIELHGLDETIYEETLKNGLRIYVWENHKVNTFKGTITFLVGSDMVKFKVGKELVEVPFGTSHYLEHILCKNEHNETILQDFQKLGSYSNAFTSPNRTVFEFVGTSHLEENVKLLLDTVQNKKFDEVAFQSERGPILEEERMYEDNANRKIGVEINRSLFYRYPNQVQGIGTKEDILNIKLEDLKTIYDAFYQPDNAFLTITGNVDAQKIIAYIKEIEENKKVSKTKNVSLPHYREPKKVKYKRKDISVNIEIPKVYVNVKIPKKNFYPYDDVEVLNALQMILSSNFGLTSDLKEELISKKLVLNLYAYISLERDFYVISLSARTKYKEEVMKRLQEKLFHLELNKEDLERKRKVEIATLVLSYEDPEFVNDMISYRISEFHKLYENEKEILEGLTYNKIKDIFSKCSMKEVSVLVANPKKAS